MQNLSARTEKLNKKLDALRKKLQDFYEKRESYKSRYEAEKDRRSKLSRKNQELEEEINDLENKISDLEDEKDYQGSEETAEELEETEAQILQDKSVEQAKSILEKLESVSSSELDCVTAYKTSGELPDEKGLKNTLTSKQFSFVTDKEGIFFLEPEFIQLRLNTRDFFEPEWDTGGKFETEKLRNFIETRKQWAIVSAGETVILREESGEILDREEVTSRVDSKQKKGGFSQGRFERKRDEQIDEHLNQVEEEIADDTLLVGEERLCKNLPGKYLGGFDDSGDTVDSLYGFRLEKM
jgi:predicted RNase H-like nuclease (RuvC/YqgF family)